MPELAHYGGMQIGIVAAGAIGAYRGVGYNNDLPAAEGDPVRGISLMASEAAGDHITIGCSGEWPVHAGVDVATNNLSPGDPVAFDTTGRAILANAATDTICGRAVGSASATGDLVLIDFAREGLLT